MFMEYFILKSEIINLLINNREQVSNIEMESAYDRFVEEVRALNQPESDFQTVYRVLNLTRIELVSYQYEQEKKCP